VNKQPNSRMCFVCGRENPIGLKLKIYETEPGVIETSLTAPTQYQSYPGILHGGIVASILDEMSGRAHLGNTENPRFMFTAKLEVKYRHNVPIGKRLKVVGKAGKTSGRMAEGWAGIYDGNDMLLAECKTLLVDVPPSMTNGSDLDTMGWKIDPD
jgi:acyl-coenzyme A thioesterase PaaI-like protein